MAWTYHGHQIPNSPVDEPTPDRVARCGGVQMCRDCVQDVANWNMTKGKELVATQHTDQTMHKVFDALKKLGLADRLVIDAIHEMQNNGILFRERA